MKVYDSKARYRSQIGGESSVKDVLVARDLVNSCRRLRTILEASTVRIIIECRMKC